MDTAVAGVMHAAPVAHALVAHPGNEGLHIPVPTAVAEPILQQQAEVGRVSYDTDDNNAEQQHGTGAYRSSALLGRKHAPDRRPLRFWQPFNDWWRAELDRMGRRPTSHDIGEWYVQSADSVWGECKPTLQETRVHAKCLRSLPLVRDYFRNYRAKKRGHKGDGLDGDEDGDTEDGTDNGTGRHTRRAKRQAASDDTDMQAAMSGMAQLGPAEMMQLQAAGLMLPQQFWAGALAGMEGHDMDDYTRAIMMQQHLQAAMLQQQMAAAAVAAQQFTGQQFGVFPAQDDDDDDEEDTDPGDGHAAAAANEPADAGNEICSGLPPSIGQLPPGSSPSGPSGPMAPAAAPPAAEEAQAVQVLLTTEGTPATAVVVEADSAAGIVDSMLVDHDPCEPGAAAGHDMQEQPLQQVVLAGGLQSLQDAVHMQAARQHPGNVHSAAAAVGAAAGEADASALMHSYMSAPPAVAGNKADVCSEAVQQQLELGLEHGFSAGHAATTCLADGCVGMPRAEAQPPAHVHCTGQLPGVTGMPGVASQQPVTAAGGASQLPTQHASATATQLQHQEPARAPEHEEVGLLPAGLLENMEQDMLVAHIKAVQEELYAKRELLKRSFDQLRRTQERLGRRERKLAKEQQKCRQYQQALAVWQASMMPMADPAAQELYQAQMQVAMAAQAAAIQQAAAAGAVPTQQ